MPSTWSQASRRKFVRRKKRVRDYHLRPMYARRNLKPYHPCGMHCVVQIEHSTYLAFVVEVAPPEPPTLLEDHPGTKRKWESDPRTMMIKLCKVHKVQHKTGWPSWFNPCAENKLISSSSSLAGHQSMFPKDMSTQGDLKHVCLKELWQSGAT